MKHFTYETHTESIVVHITFEFGHELCAEQLLTGLVEDDDFRRQSHHERSSSMQ